MFAFSGSCGVASAGGESLVDPFDEIGSRNQSPSSTRKKASSSPSSASSSPSTTRHAVASPGPSRPPPEVTSAGGYYVVAAPGPPPPGAQIVYLASPPPMGQVYQQQPPMAAPPQRQQQAPYVYYPHPPPQGVVAGHPPAFVPVGAGAAGAPAGSSKKHKIKKGFKKLSLSNRRESQLPPEYHHSRQQQQQQQPQFQQPQPHPQPRRAFSGASSFDAARSGGHGKTQQQDNAGIVLYKPAPAFCARFSLPSNCSDNVLFEGTCCAVSGSIVLDGMCYVTTNFFCFSCNFEGQTIAIKIAHSDIESLRRAYAKEYVLRRHKLPTIQREPPPCTHKHFNTLQMVTRSDNVLHTFFNFQSRKHYDALISTITERCPKAYTMNVKKPLEGDEHDEDRYEERYEETREEKERNYDSSSEEEEDSSDGAEEKGGKRSSSSSTYHPPAALHEDKGLLDVY